MVRLMQRLSGRQRLLQRGERVCPRPCRCGPTEGGSVASELPQGRKPSRVAVPSRRDRNANRSGLPFLPLAAKQILLNNFLSDLPSLALADDRVDATQVSAPQRRHLGDLRRFMLVFGLTSTAFDLLTFRVLIDAFGANEATFQTAWFVVSLLTELAVLLVLRTQRPMWASAPSLLLLVSTLAVSMLAATLPYLAIPQAMFGFVELSATMAIALLAIVVGYVSCVEAFKRVVERKRS